jgi:phosphocarrier protein FPr
MVGSVEEWRQARDMTERLRLEIPVADLQLGIMIEVPSAALLAPVLAKEVDFFSVGTNDLTQYTLAIDRGHPTLSAQADGLHPAVLQLIDITVRAAHAHGKWVGSQLIRWQFRYWSASVSMNSVSPGAALLK